MGNPVLNKLSGSGARRTKQDEVFKKLFENAGLPGPNGQGEHILEIAVAILKAVKKTTKGGADEAIDLTTKGLRNMLSQARKVHLIKVELFKATRMLQKRSDKIFGRLDNADWDEFAKLAIARVKAFRSTRIERKRGALASLKGKFAEIVFYKSDAYKLIFKNAQSLAEDINKKGGVLMRDGSRVLLKESTVMRKKVVSTLNNGKKELTDGVITAERADGGLQVLAIIEMKSPSNYKHLLPHRLKKSKLGKDIKDNVISKKDLKDKEMFDQIPKDKDKVLDEGQFSEGIERLRELDIEMDGKVYPEGTVHLSYEDTVFTAVTPMGVTIGKNQTDEISKLIKNFKRHNLEVNDRTLNKICEKMLELLSDVVD